MSRPTHLPQPPRRAASGRRPTRREPPQPDHDLGALLEGIVINGVIIAAVAWLQAPGASPPRPEPPPWATRHDDAPVSPFGPQPHDNGGLIERYVIKVHVANRRRERVEIRGTCVSACTLLLGAADVCVHRDAMLWFHAAYNLDTKIIDAGATRKMALYWGPKVAAWARSVGATESVAFTRRRALSGEEAIRLGVAACESRQ